jgi:hypothetical protein
VVVVVKVVVVVDGSNTRHDALGRHLPCKTIGILGPSAKVPGFISLLLSGAQKGAPEFLINLNCWGDR